MRNSTPFAIGIFATTTAALVCPAPAHAAAFQGEDIERVTASALAPVTLPAGAYRSTSEGDVSKFTEALRSTAETNKGRITATEVLIWKKSDRPHEKITDALKTGGYGCVLRPAFKVKDLGNVTPLASTRKDKKHNLLGFFVESGDMFLLAWGVFVFNEGEGPETDPNPLPSGSPTQATRPAEASSSSNSLSAIFDRHKSAIEQPGSATASGTKQDVSFSPVSASGRAPADVLGVWSWTTISSVGYKDPVTGRLAEPSGMSVKFTFSKDGRYKKFFYVRQRTYGLLNEATTTEEGTVTFAGDGTFLMRPEKGHYVGIVNNRPLDRDMTREDLKPATYRWEWRSENNKRNLYIGPGPSSMSLFKPAE